MDTCIGIGEDPSSGPSRYIVLKDKVMLSLLTGSMATHLLYGESGSALENPLELGGVGLWPAKCFLAFIWET